VERGLEMTVGQLQRWLNVTVQDKQGLTEQSFVYIMVGGVRVSARNVELCVASSDVVTDGQGSLGVRDALMVLTDGRAQ
jgi:hypothetical protein